jgi:hypothetical protein
MPELDSISLCKSKEAMGEEGSSFRSECQSPSSNLLASFLKRLLASWLLLTFSLFLARIVFSFSAISEEKVNAHEKLKREEEKDFFPSS